MSGMRAVPLLAALCVATVCSGSCPATAPPGAVSMNEPGPYVQDFRRNFPDLAAGRSDADLLTAAEPIVVGIRDGGTWGDLLAMVRSGYRAGIDAPGVLSLTAMLAYPDRIRQS